MSNDKYINCSRCKCKYINDDEHIKLDFGYNRLNVRFKTCNTCRDKRYAYMCSESGKASVQSYRDSNRDKINKYNFEKLTCGSCGASVCRNAKRQHERDKGCVFDKV